MIYFNKITFRGWNLRKKKEPQLNLLNLMPRYKIAQELEAMAHLLDANRDILDLVYRDLVKYRRQDTGRNGMTASRCCVAPPRQPAAVLPPGKT